MSGWIGCDLDGTLAHYEPTPAHLWDPMKIGAPVPKMLARVKGWVAEGREVRIVTARVAVVAEGSDYLAAVQRVQQVTRRIKDWLEEHGLPRLPVTCQKDYAMLELWDDRAVQVVKNTGLTFHEQFLQDIDDRGLSIG